MNKKRVKLLIILLTTIIIISGCSSTKDIKISELEKEITELEQKMKIESEIEIDHSKENIEKTPEEILEIIRTKVMELKDYDDFVIFEKSKDNLYMVRAEEATFSDSYFLYDSKEDEIFVMPTGCYYASKHLVLDDNHVRLFMTGANSEFTFQEIPFIYDFWKIYLADGSSEFRAIENDKYFSRNEDLYFGGKGGQSIKDIIITLNGLQVAFGPQDPNDAMYYAGSVSPPFTNVSFDKANNQIIVLFEDTIIDEDFAKKEHLVDEGYGYIESVLFEKDNNSLLMTLKLKEDSDYREIIYYTANILQSLTTPAAIEINFHTELPYDY